MTIRNQWVLKIIEELEKEGFHGKLQINMCGSDVPNIDIHRHILKPRKKEDKESSLKS